MAKPAKTAHEIVLDAFVSADDRAAFDREATVRAEINALVSGLDDLRVELDLSKSDLAREAGVNPVSVRRLLTAETSNPEVRTLLQLAYAMGYELTLTPRADNVAVGSTDALAG